MVLDSLSNSAKYNSLHPAFEKAFDFIQNTDFSTLKPGMNVIDGDKLFVNYASCTTKTAEEAKIETHNEYIDIQVAIEQTEYIGYTPTCDLKDPIGPYNADSDITFFNDKPQTMLTMNPGQFTIFWPEDGHQPAIGEGNWKKLIVKVKL